MNLLHGPFLPSVTEQFHLFPCYPSRKTQAIRVKAYLYNEFMYMHAVCLHTDTIRIQLWVSRMTTVGTGTQTDLWCLETTALSHPLESQCEQGEVSICECRYLKDMTEVY